MCTFVPNKSCGSLLEKKNHIFLKTFSSEFKKTEVWFTDQNIQPLETEDKLNLTLITNVAIMKMRYSIEPRD